MGLHDNPRPQGPNPEMAKEEENNAILGLSFPRKLWRIVEDAAFTSVHWNDEGDTVVIEADPDNHDGVITHLEPDILEYEVKWA